MCRIKQCTSSSAQSDYFLQNMRSLHMSLLAAAIFGTKALAGIKSWASPEYVQRSSSRHRTKFHMLPSYWSHTCFALLIVCRYKYIFQFPLPIPPPLPPSISYTNETTGKSIDFYEIKIQDFEKQLYPGLQTTSLTGYNGMAPGPTLYMTRGREAVVRFINRSKRDSSIHLHGYVR